MKNRDAKYRKKTGLVAYLNNSASIISSVALMLVFPSSGNTEPIGLNSPNSAWKIRTTPPPRSPITPEQDARKQINSSESDAPIAPNEPLPINIKSNSIDEQPRTVVPPERAKHNKLREQQLEAIRVLEESEDAFDERFSELYLAYGQSLLRAGYLDEAIKMFKTALHNVKINNGVRSLDQRPILRILFETNMENGRYLEAEQNLKRILWVDSEQPEDQYSLDMITKMANYFFNQYLTSRTVTHDGLVGLNKAIAYFGYAIDKYKNLENRSRLPYGDIAHAHYLKDLAHKEIDPSLYINAQRKSLDSLMGLGITRSSIENSFSQSNRYLKSAYEWFKESRDLRATVTALVHLGDLHLLYGSVKGAETYYVLAYKLALDLPPSHRIRLSFAKPAKLPAFNSLVDRSNSSITNNEIVPMIFDVEKNGSVSSVSRLHSTDISMGLRIRANKAAKRLRFRPIISHEGISSYPDYTYDLRVASLSKETARTN